jgi:hypothetical protein
MTAYGQPALELFERGRNILGAPDFKPEPA